MANQLEAHREALRRLADSDTMPTSGEAKQQRTELLARGRIPNPLTLGEDLITAVGHAWYAVRYAESGRDERAAAESSRKLIYALSTLLNNPEYAYTKDGKSFLATTEIGLRQHGRTDRTPKTDWHRFLILIEHRHNARQVGIFSSIERNYHDKGSYTPPHIKPSHKGRFTAYAKRNGLNKTEAISRAKHSGSLKLKREAIFAQNASHWNHHHGRSGGGGGGSELSNVGDRTPVGDRTSFIEPRTGDDDGDNNDSDDDATMSSASEDDEGENERNELIEANRFYNEEIVKTAQVEILLKCERYLRLVASLSTVFSSVKTEHDFAKERNEFTFETVDELIHVLSHYEQIVVSWMEIKQFLYDHIFLGALKEADVEYVSGVLLSRHPELVPFAQPARSIDNVLFFNFLDRYMCSKAYVGVKESEHFKIWQLENTDLYLGRFRRPSTLEESEQRKDVWTASFPTGDESAVNAPPWNDVRDYMLSHFHHSTDFSQRLCWRRPFAITRTDYLPDDVRNRADDAIIDGFHSYAYVNGTFVRETGQVGSKEKLKSPLRGLFKLSAFDNAPAGGMPFNALAGVPMDVLQMKTCLPIAEIRYIPEERVYGYTSDVNGNNERMIYYANAHVNALDECEWTIDPTHGFYGARKKTNNNNKEEKVALKRDRHDTTTTTTTTTLRSTEDLQCHEQLDVYAVTFEKSGSNFAPRYESSAYTFQNHIDRLVKVDSEEREYQIKEYLRLQTDVSLFGRNPAAARREMKKVDPLTYLHEGKNLYGNFPLPFPNDAEVEDEINYPDGNKKRAPVSEEVRKWRLKSNPEVKEAVNLHYELTGLYAVVLNHLCFRCEIECLTSDDGPFSNEAVLSPCTDDPLEWLKMTDPAAQVNPMWFKAGLRGFLVLKGLQKLTDKLNAWKASYEANATYGAEEKESLKRKLNVIARAASDFIHIFACPKETKRPIPLYKVELVENENEAGNETIERPKRQKTRHQRSGNNNNNTETTSFSSSGPGPTKKQLR